MAQISIVRTNADMPDDKSMEAVRAFLFDCIRGLRDEDEKAWRKLWRWISKLEAGELCNIEFKFPRNSKFHRKLFALLLVGFEAWEPGRKHKTYKGIPIAKNFEQFREDITILAGFFEQTFTLRGEMRLRAKSISFAKMDDAEFESLYSAVADVLLDRVLTAYKGREELDDVVDRIMRFQS
jgi:hypothetical protein